MTRHLMLESHAARSKNIWMRLSYYRFERPKHAVQLFMKTSIFALLTLILCLAETIAQGSERQTQPRRLSYEQVLERWDRSRAYGSPRSLRQFSDDMVTRFKSGDEADDFSEGLRDGPWIRFYARGEQIFRGSTGIVIIGALMPLYIAQAIAISVQSGIWLAYLN